MRDRIGTVGPIAAVAGVLGICCGLPVLLSLGLLGAAAGLSLQSWALIGFGLVVAVVGGARWWSRRSQAMNASCDTPTHETTKGNHP